jgi:dephospho-CoA kinase
MSWPFQVGVTGGIGSGKSLVCQIFKILGVPVYNADHRAKWLMNNDEPLRTAIVHSFGSQSFDSNSNLNNTYLATVVFNDKEKLGELNKLVHPRVAKDYRQWISQHKQENYVIKEAALLIEAGSYKTLDSIVVVSATEELRIGRVLKRDPFRTREQIMNIIKNQLSEIEKLELTEYIIDNESNSMVIPQVLELHKIFKSKNANK